MKKIMTKRLKEHSDISFFAEFIEYQKVSEHDQKAFAEENKQMPWSCF